MSALAAVALCVAWVHDGDTLRSCSGERIRLAGIDAPELPGSPSCHRRRNNGWCDDPARARESRDALRRLLASGSVTIHRKGRDGYGRTLARLRVNGRDVGGMLIAAGLARKWP